MPKNSYNDGASFFSNTETSFDVNLIEVGPRDGFQQEKKIIPTPLKVEIITDLFRAGLRRIQVTSFVNPRLVPQMADAEQVIASLPKWQGTTINALVLNKRGLTRALDAGVNSVEISVSASDTHSRKNTGMSRKTAMADALEMIGLAQKQGCQIRAGIQCAFGCVYEGPIPLSRVLEMSQQYIRCGVDMLAIADTTGMADPAMITGLLDELHPLCNGVPVVMHLHDTRGMGLANMVAAMAAGVAYFDTGVGGLGGCPFVPGAVGNINTLTAARMLQRMAIDTGLDLLALEKCTAKIINFLRA